MSRLGRFSLFFAALLISGVLAAAGLELTSPVGDTPVALHNAAQKSYLTMMPRALRVKRFADKKYRAEMVKAGFYPLPVELAWRWSGDGRPTYRVEVAEAPDFLNAETFETTGNSGTVGNLKIAKTYYWRVTAMIDGKALEAKAGSFRTEDLAPRLVRINGVPNVRDLGGRIGLDGRRVRQGMIYRSAGLNDNASSIKVDSVKVLADWQAPEAEFYRERISAFEKMADQPSQITLLPFALSSKWTAFRLNRKRQDADFVESLQRLNSIPAMLDGASAEPVTLASGRFSFKTATPDALAVFMQEFDSKEDGFMPIGGGADWFWLMFVNGGLAFSRFDGNTTQPISPENFAFLIPVKKGKNLVVAAVWSGTVSWTWCCAAPAPTPVGKLAKATADSLLDDVIRVTGTPTKASGRNRLNKDMQRYMTDKLGIRSDIDLRSDGECYGMTGSPAGDKVKWFHYSSQAYKGLQLPLGREAFTQVFKVFLDPANYPIVFHCIAGQDRTGAVAFILNGLLGVNEEDLYLDWESTGFWNRNAGFNHRNLFNRLVAGFDRYPGDTLNRRIENYVLSLGFTEKDIASFRKLMLE